MNMHLTEQQLIDYQFKLASDAGMEEARAHVERCEACHQRLADLNRKFAALDLLREEVKLSDALIARTVENAVKARRMRIIPLLRMPWLGATAAAIIVGVALLVVSNLGPQGQRQGVLMPTAPEMKNAPAQRAEREIAPTSERPMPYGGKAGADAYQLKQALAEPGVTGGSAKPEGLARSVPGTVGAGFKPARAAQEETPHGVTTSTLDVMEEKPPFAPASAIELVVLPRRENVQLTIYNGADLTLVRERRNLTLKQGWNWLQFMWANTLIDPTSLTLEPLKHKDQVQIQQLVFPPRLRELGRWLIHSEVTGQVPFEMTYFTSGLAWRAFYMGTLSQDEETMHLEAYVRVNNNSGEDYEDAQTRLIVGQVRLLDQIRELAQRQYPYGSPLPAGMLGGMGGYGAVDKKKDRYLFDAGGEPAVQLMKSLERKEIQKEGLSEYFLYTIGGTETIPNEWGKRLLSFEADGIPVKALYKYDEERWGDQTIRFVSFANDEEHKLGETPLPDGTVRIYGRADEQGHLSYVGAADVKYIPVGEEIELDLGPARLVEVKPVLMDERTENHVFDQDGNVNGWDEVRTWRLEIVNTRTLPVEIEITRGFETAYWTLKQGDTTASYEKYDVTHARFRLTVQPRSKRACEYTVTTYHGVRQEVLPNAQ